MSDANLAALGEPSLGAGRAGQRAVCYVTVADGISAGFMDPTAPNARCFIVNSAH